MAQFTHVVGSRTYVFDDLRALLARATLLAAAGCTFVMGVAGADDIMLHYQSTSFHDALYARRLLGLRPAPEFETWLKAMGIFGQHDGVQLGAALPPPFQRALDRLMERDAPRPALQVQP